MRRETDIDASPERYREPLVRRRKPGSAPRQLAPRTGDIPNLRKQWVRNVPFPGAPFSIGRDWFRSIGRVGWLVAQLQWPLGRAIAASHPWALLKKSRPSVRLGPGLRIAKQAPKSGTKWASFRLFCNSWRGVSKAKPALYRLQERVPILMSGAIGVLVAIFLRALQIGFHGGIGEVLTSARDRVHVGEPGILLQSS
jgi:hypothetical protein